MSRWDTFLEGLATAGGNLFILVFMVLTFSSELIHIMHHPNEISAQMATTFTNVLMAFVGALGNALMPRKPEKPTSEKTDSVTQTTTVSGQSAVPPS